MTQEISIVVASYNHEAFLGNTLCSIQAQTLHNWEGIVVDDGSSDNSPAVIRAFTEGDRRFRLYQHEGGHNRGLSETLQLGIRHAAAKWIAFCESDDWWEPIFLQQLMKRMRDTPQCGVIFADVVLEGTSESMAAHCAMVREHFRRGGQPPALYRLLRNAVPTMSCAMVRADLIRTCNFQAHFPPSLDMWLWAQLARKTEFAFVDEPLCHWRQHDASYMKRETKPDILDMSKVQDFYAQIRELFPSREPRSHGWSARLRTLQQSLHRLKLLFPGR